MLKNIKSSYFYERIFSYIEEGQKLKIIKNNKRLQKFINISINNYKHYKGRYIIYKSKGIGKEYNGYSDQLVFEGGYINGKRNGKGKEYNDIGDIKFEGEYLNGKRNGKGKEYNFFNGNIIFEGVYLNGERNKYLYIN